MHRVAWFALALAWWSLPWSGAQAQRYMEGPTSHDVVVAYNTGFRFSFMPGLLLPTRGGGDIGFALAVDGRYGFETGPVILAPGLRLGTYFPAGLTALMALGTFRLTVPVGPVGPYVLGGVGPGYISDPSGAGLAYLAGGGFMVHFGGGRFGLGADVAYQSIVDKSFDILTFGPSFLLSW